MQDDGSELSSWPAGSAMYGYRRRTSRIFNTLGILWFVIVGPLALFVYKLPFILDFVLAFIVPVGIGTVGAYLSRPNKFRPGAKIRFRDAAAMLLFLIVFFVFMFFLIEWTLSPILR